MLVTAQVEYVKNVQTDIEYVEANLGFRKYEMLGHEKPIPQSTVVAK